MAHRRFIPVVPHVLVIFKFWTRLGRGRRFEARTRPRQKRRGKAEARPRQTFFEARTRQHQMLPRGASRQGICLEDYITANMMERTKTKRGCVTEKVDTLFKVVSA